MKNNKSILCIGDLHEPFSHPDAPAFVSALKTQYKPDCVVFLGDEVDYHSLSKYDYDPDGLSPGDEHRAALKALKKWFHLFPKAKVCWSNHTARAWKKAFSSGIPREFLRDVRSHLHAPEGWEWRDSWTVSGVHFEHGEGFSGINAARSAAIANMRSTVIGHVHAHGGIQYVNNKTAHIWGMNVGCLIWHDAYVFSYAKHSKNLPTLGVGYISRDGVPNFIPMLLSHTGRWVGKI